VPLSHAKERFTEAVHVLSTGRGRISERLTDAFGHHLAHIRPEQDLPQGELRRAFMRLLEVITAREPAPQEEGAAQARMRLLSEDEAVEIVNQILQLAVLVELAFEEERAP
jgi:hypothetical protein